MFYTLNCTLACTKTFFCLITTLASSYKDICGCKWDDQLQVQDSKTLAQDIQIDDKDKKNDVNI